VSVLSCAVQSETEVRRSELRRLKRKTRIYSRVAESSKTKNHLSSDYLDCRSPSGYVFFVDFMLI
jgi:hypothetical protein